MTLSNWLGILATVLIIAAGVSLNIYFRRKFTQIDGFDGIVTERGASLRGNKLGRVQEETPRKSVRLDND